MTLFEQVWLYVNLDIKCATSMEASSFITRGEPDLIGIWLTSGDGDALQTKPVTEETKRVIVELHIEQANTICGGRTPLSGLRRCAFVFLLEKSSFTGAKVNKALPDLEVKTKGKKSMD